jgi:hypothetical protein
MRIIEEIDGGLVALGAPVFCFPVELCPVHSGATRRYGFPLL